jgi:hypothetical protein
MRTAAYLYPWDVDGTVPLPAASPGPGWLRWR